MKVITVLLLVILAASAAFCGDIVTVPTANQLKAGQVDVAYYYLGLDTSAPQPSFVQIQTIYVGLTDRLEVDIHRYDPEKNLDKSVTIVNGSIVLVPETAMTPSVVFGGRNLGGTTTTNAPVESDKRSWFISAAKNITPMLPTGPKLPLVRIHASLGTEDWTLLGIDRHKGLFGGVQALFTPELGAIALQDGEDLITGLTYMPGNKGLTIKGGTYGDHWWAGISYLKAM